MAIEVTDTALEHADRLRAKEGHPESAFLRIGVNGGGCSGYSYVLKFDTESRDGDEVVRERDDVRVVVDPKSKMFLDGMKLDFTEGINGKGFEFVNPNAKATCGCGQSFSV